jgi:hypothetical protein
MDRASADVDMLLNKNTFFLDGLSLALSPQGKVMMQTMTV